MKNLMKSRVVKKVIPTRTRHDEFREVLPNFELRIHLKAPFLISLTLFLISLPLKLTLAKYSLRNVNLNFFDGPLFH